MIWRPAMPLASTWKASTATRIAASTSATQPPWSTTCCLAPGIKHKQSQVMSLMLSRVWGIFLFKEWKITASSIVCDVDGSYGNHTWMGTCTVVFYRVKIEHEQLEHLNTVNNIRGCKNFVNWQQWLRRGLARVIIICFYDKRMTTDWFLTKNKNCLISCF